MPISPGLLREAISFFKCDFYQPFGPTEGGTCSYLGPEDHVTEGPEHRLKRLQSVGRSFFLAETKIVDQEGREVGIGEVGEVVVKSDAVIQGYWKLPEETRKAIRDGWLHTGDMARIDEDGYIYLVDRKRDMIISGGENIYPSEIENVINSHPAVHASAVIAVPDEEWGESVKAVVVVEEGEHVSEDEIISFCKERLAGYKKPKSVDFAESLPRNPIGKLLRKELREKYWKEHDRRIH
jgi:long-chain acyl-CoA synthetase